MKDKDDLVYLNHIQDAISRIEEFTKETTHNFFTANKLIQNGVIREIEIIGEASKRLSSALRRKHSHIGLLQNT